MDYIAQSFLRFVRAIVGWLTSFYSSSEVWKEHHQGFLMPGALAWQWCAPGIKQVSSLLDCTWQIKEMILPLCSAQVRHSWIQGSQHRRDMDIKKRVQWMTTKTIKGREHPSHEERIGELGWFSLKKWRFKGDFVNLNKCRKGGARRTQPGSLQWCLVTGQEAKLPKKVVESPSLDIFRLWLKVVLNNLIWLTLLWAEGLG